MSRKYGAPATARHLDLGATARNLLSSGTYVIKGIKVYNSDSAAAYVKFYNKQSATSGDTPILTLGLPAGSGDGVGFESGLFVVTAGLSVRSVTTLADNGNTGNTSGTVAVTVFYSKPGG